MSPHAGLCGNTPARRWAERIITPVTEDQLDVAMTFRVTRQVRQDSTVSVAGTLWELRLSVLNGQRVDVVRSLCDRTRAPWIEHGDRRYELKRVDPVANGQSGRRALPASKRVAIDNVPFDPPGVLLDQLMRRGGNRG